MDEVLCAQARGLVRSVRKDGVGWRDGEPKSRSLLSSLRLSASAADFPPPDSASSRPKFSQHQFNLLSSSFDFVGIYQNNDMTDDDLAKT